MSQMITPFTTPRQHFTFPDEVVPGECVAIKLLYGQGGKVLITKQKSDLTIDGQEVEARLSAEESCLFHEGESVELELWVKLISGDVPTPWKIQLTVDEVMNGEAL